MHCADAAALNSREHAVPEVQADSVHGSDCCTACCWRPALVQAAVAPAAHPGLQHLVEHVLLHLWGVKCRSRSEVQVEE